MAGRTITTTVQVCEDTDQEFNVLDLLAANGYIPIEPISIEGIFVRNPDDTFVDPPTPLFQQSGPQTLLVTASNVANYSGNFTTYTVILDTGGNVVTLELIVEIVPVNDAPEGADKTIDLGDGAAYTFSASDFGFVDAVEGHGFKSVVITSLPTGGLLTLNGTALTAVPAEVLVTDIQSGSFQFVPTSSGSMDFGFQVRDDGGTAGCNASDLDGTPNTITFNVPFGSIGDRLWNDANANGIQDSGETGVAGVTVSLIAAGADGVLGNADDSVTTTTTDTAGNYIFTGLQAGQYQVQFASVAGYQFTTANAGTNDAQDSDVGADGKTATITLAAGQNITDVDAGVRLEAKGSIGDRVWRDSNGNGVQDSGEQGVACVTVKLWTAGTDGAFGTGDDVLAGTTTTDYCGNYLFENLTAGNYRVQFSAIPSGLDFTTRNATSDDTRDSDAGANGFSHVIDLAAGEHDRSVDAGLVKTVCASIVGADKIYEGNSASYKVQLNCAVSVDTWVTVAAIDGTAGRTGFKADCQEIIAGGYYDVRNSRGDVVAYYYNKIPNHMTYASYGNRDATGPSDMSWDYALVGTDCRIDADGVIQVRIAAGSTQSAAFSVQSWKEKVYVDGDVFPCGGYKETAWENLTLTITATSNALVEACCPAKTVYIGDCTSYQLFSPIALDLDGNGIQTTALIDSQGTFDLLGTGQAVHSGWLSSGDAFLAVDNNGNGVIDDISELFGGKVGEGFAKLATFDTDGNGVVDAADASFGQLLVWQDANGNHATDAGELRTLAEAGLSALNVSYTMLAEDQLGNVLGERSVATRTDGSQIDMIDVYFNMATDDASMSALPELSSLLSPSNSLLDSALGAPDLSVPASNDAAALPVGGDEAEALRRLTACAA